MPYEHNNNSGSMWFSAEKKTEKSPDFRGEINLGGKLHFLSGWNRKTASGKEWISVMVKPKEAPPQGQPAQPAQRNVPVSDSGDLPF